MFARRKPTATVTPKVTTADPRFPDYSKVTGNGYDNDQEVKRCAR